MEEAWSKNSLLFQRPRTFFLIEKNLLPVMEEKHDYNHHLEVILKTKT